MKKLKLLIIFIVIFVVKDVFAAITTVKPTTKAPTIKTTTRASGVTTKPPITTTKKSLLTTKPTLTTKKPTIVTTTIKPTTVKPTLIPYSLFSVKSADPLARAIVNYSGSSMTILTTTQMPTTTTKKTLPFLGTSRGLSVNVPFSISRMMPIVEPSYPSGAGKNSFSTWGGGTGGSGTGGSGTGGSATGGTATGVSATGGSGFGSGPGKGHPGGFFQSGTGNSGSDNTGFGSGPGSSWNSKPDTSHVMGWPSHTADDEDKQVKRPMVSSSNNDNNGNNNDKEDKDKKDKNKGNRRDRIINSIGLGGKGFPDTMGKIKDVISTVSNGFRKMMQNRGNNDNSNEYQDGAHSGKRG